MEKYRAGIDTNVLHAGLYSAAGVFIMSAVSEKISAITTEKYIANRAKNARKGTFKKVLDRVLERKPLSGDER